MAKKLPRYKITAQGQKTRKKLRWKFVLRDRSLIFARYDVLDNLMKGSRTRNQLLMARMVSIEATNNAIRVLLNSGDIVVKL